MSSCSKPGNNFSKKSQNSNQPEQTAPLSTPKPSPFYNDYTITLTLDPQNSSISAIEKITLKNETNHSIEKLTMNVPLNNPTFVQNPWQNAKPDSNLKTFSVQSLSIGNEEAEYQLQGSVLEIFPFKALKTQEEAELTIEFTATIPKSNSPIGTDGVHYWIANALPTITTETEISTETDILLSKANISNYFITIITPENYSVIAPGFSTSSIENGQKTTHIAAKLVRNFSFAALKDMQKTSVETASGIDITLYYNKDSGRWVNEILSFAKRDLEFYEQNIGSYPYRNLEIIEGSLPWSKDMECSQFVLLDQSVFRSEIEPEESPFRFAHQWFNLAVGLDKQESEWLHSGISSFLHSYLTYGENQLKNYMADQQAALDLYLETEPVPPIDAPFTEFSSFEHYQNLVVKRSELMVYHLYLEMGKENFYLLLKKYYAAYSFKIAEPSDFITLCEQIAEKDMSLFFKTWIE